MGPHRRRSVVAAILAGSVALTTVGAAAQSAVKIGVLTDLSGPYAEITGKSAVHAARMAIDDFGGVVLGQPVVVVAADHQGKADVGLAVAREWLDTQGVTTILDANNSSVGLAVNELVRGRRRIFLARASSDDLTEKACSPDTTTQWVASTGGLARAVALPAARAGLTDWFFLTANYAFGHALEEQGIAAITSAGGRVLGTARFPSGTSDFSSFLLEAQRRGAKTVAIAAAGQDVSNIVKQVREFGLAVEIVPFYLAEPDIDAAGLDALAGVRSAITFFWNRTDESRAFAARFKSRTGRLPTFAAQQSYSAVTHYLKAVRAAGTIEAGAVSAAMRAAAISDASGFSGTVRADGRVMSDMFAVTVTSRAGSTGEWDYFRLSSVESPAVIYPAAAESRCRPAAPSAR